MDERALLRQMFDAAVAEAMPDVVLPRHLPPPPAGRTIVVGAGKASSNFLHASNPPAEAPIATIGNSKPPAAEAGPSIQRAAPTLRRCGSLGGMSLFFSERDVVSSNVRHPYHGIAAPAIK